MPHSLRMVMSCMLICYLTACKNEGNTKVELFQSLPSSKTGVNFVNQLTEKKLNIISYMYYYNGGGVAAGDFNNDGLIDLYFTANELENRLYINKGDLAFEDVTAQAGVGGSGEWSTGVTLVDINNDGWLDIYVCYVGGINGLQGRNQLFVNNGDLTFTDKAAAYGLDFSGFSTQAVFFDYDNDGDLDMYLLNHSVHSVNSYGSASKRMEKSEQAGDRLFQNQKDRGELAFKDVTESAGIYSSYIGYGLGISVADVNRDGWLDIYVANDFHENDYLYVNNGDGTFTEQLERMVTGTSRYSMGCDIGDLNGDGLVDIVSLDMLPEDPSILLRSASEDTQEVSDIKKSYGYGSQYVRNALQLNRGDHFIDIGQYAGIHATDWSWSALIADFDNDGNSELFITNGIYKRPNDLDYIQYTAEAAGLRIRKDKEDSLELEMIKRLPTLKIPNYMYRRNSGYKFENVADNWGLAQPSYSGGSVYADLDNDGDLDLVVNNVNQEAFVYENKANLQTSNHFLKITLQSVYDSLGLGAEVEVYTSKRVLIRNMILTRGFQSAVSPVIHVGLGKDETIDSVAIYWRGNQVQVERFIQANQLVRIHERENLPMRKRSATSNLNFPASYTNFPWTHQENIEYRDYYNEPLIPYLLSREGPALAVGDVNNDGIDDVFFGGAHGQAGALYIQQVSGTFVSASINTFLKDIAYEDVDAAFIDVDADGDLDLYVVSGGGQYEDGHLLLEDRLYLNDGHGNLTRSRYQIPVRTNGSCVRVADINKDGHPDLFIGGRSKPGQYGVSPNSYVLENNGKGNFTIRQKLVPGMITDAAWGDMDADGDLDLVVVGDWMPVLIYTNENGILNETPTSLENTEGWWRCVSLADINHDGIPDILAGNSGMNMKLKASLKYPSTIHIGDFDSNGKIDPVITYYVNERQIPFASKTSLAKQMPFISKRYLSNTEFSGIQSASDFLPELEAVTVKKCVTFETTVFTSKKKGSWEPINLPEETQFTAVNYIMVEDFNSDGFPDILIAGNFSESTIALGNSGGQSLFVLEGNESGNFKFKPIATRDYVKDIIIGLVPIKIVNTQYLLLARNNDIPILYKSTWK